MFVVTTCFLQRGPITLSNYKPLYSTHTKPFSRAESGNIVSYPDSAGNSMFLILFAYTVCVFGCAYRYQPRTHTYGVEKVTWQNTAIVVFFLHHCFFSYSFYFTNNCSALLSLSPLSFFQACFCSLSADFHVITSLAVFTLLLVLALLNSGCLRVTFKTNDDNDNGKACKNKALGKLNICDFCYFWLPG